MYSIHKIFYITPSEVLEHCIKYNKIKKDELDTEFIDGTFSNLVNNLPLVIKQVEKMEIKDYDTCRISRCLEKLCKSDVPVDKFKLIKFVCYDSFTLCVLKNENEKSDFEIVLNLDHLDTMSRYATAYNCFTSTIFFGGLCLFVIKFLNKSYIYIT